MEEIGEQSMKHMCRFCNKSFPCGRSLGGHMRSHVMINSTHHHHHHQVENKSVVDKLCKECGKGFQSWKALFGHMKCHSTKLSNNKNKNITSMNQDSWTSHSDNENSDLKNCPIKRSRSRSNKNKKFLTSIVSETEEEQEAEVAISLMMLSEDSIRNGSKTNRFAETKVSFDYLGRSEVGLTKIIEFDSDLGEFKDSKKRKFEYVTCNKSFHSHQPLGGHKASHQKLKKDFDSKILNENKIEHKPVLDHDQTINGHDSRASNDHQESSSSNLDVGSLKKKLVLRAHECPICFKIFTSGQALGGHKRSHLTCEAKLNQENHINVIKKPDEVVRDTRGFLDLNMLPEEDEEMNMISSTTEYKSYCWEDSSDHHSHESSILCLL